MGSKAPFYETQGVHTFLPSSHSSLFHSSSGFYIVKPPGSRSRYHYHERRESVWFVLEGEIEATIDGKTERIGPNTLVFTQPGQKHRLTVVGDKDLRMIEFFTHPEPDMIYVE